MAVKTEKHSSSLVVIPQASLTLENAEHLIHAVRLQLDAAQKKIIVSLKEINYIDSHGLAMLVRCHNECKDGGALFHVCDAVDYVNEIFRIAGLQNFFQPSLPLTTVLSESNKDDHKTAPEVKKLDSYIVEIMSFLLESEMSKTWRTNEIMDLLGKIREEHNNLANKHDK